MVPQYCKLSRVLNPAFWPLCLAKLHLIANHSVVAVAKYRALWTKEGGLQTSVQRCKLGSILTLASPSIINLHVRTQTALA